MIYLFSVVCMYIWACVCHLMHVKFRDSFSPTAWVPRIALRTSVLRCFYLLSQIISLLSSRILQCISLCLDFHYLADLFLLLFQSHCLLLICLNHLSHLGLCIYKFIYFYLFSNLADDTFLRYVLVPFGVHCYLLSWLPVCLTLTNLGLSVLFFFSKNQLFLLLFFLYFLFITCYSDELNHFFFFMSADLFGVLLILVVFPKALRHIII